MSGCYGSTEPATNIGLDHATLNAVGNTQDAKTFAYFQYWTGPQSSGVSTTTPRDLPASVHGPFKDQATGLSPDTEYSFRLCGGSGGEFACAQTRTFRTLPGDEANSLLHVNGGPDARLHAISGPHGETARGYLAFDDNSDPPTSYEVVCLSVHGSEAVVGTRLANTTGGGTLYGLLAGTNAVTSSGASDPTKCSAYRPSDLAPTVAVARTTLHDAP